MTNQPNAYRLSLRLEAASGTRDETWEVRGAQVWVRWDGTALDAGDVSLTLTSPEGVTAYREVARPGVVPPAAASTVASAGPWQVHLAWSGATGHLAIDLSGVR